VHPDAPVPKVFDLYRRIEARVPRTRIVNNHNLLTLLRVVKEPGELELMRKAIAITERGLSAALRQVRVGMKEIELKRIIESVLQQSGATGLAFPTIVGSGPKHTPMIDGIEKIPTPSHEGLGAGMVTVRPRFIRHIVDGNASLGRLVDRDVRLGRRDAIDYHFNRTGAGFCGRGNVEVGEDHGGAGRDGHSAVIMRLFIEDVSGSFVGNPH
jgi:Metallopeptidase family M24